MLGLLYKVASSDENTNIAKNTDNPLDDATIEEGEGIGSLAKVRKVATRI